MTQVYNVKQQITNNLRTIQASVPGLPRYSDFPSMKTGKNVDGKLENGFPSMKTAENVDDNLKSDLSSMKTAENVDENCQNHEREHETEVDRPSKCF